MDEKTKPCDHDACNCRVPAEQEFCSEACRMAVESQTMSGQCECGHAACQQRVRS
ncbi:putative nucleic acid-binding Zn ribbon protein [Luteibacter sp. Sphag1AF]|nr:putative nucleic acid-binding Zn ribbon protein [Luteibacter sp. Sphag1AF]